MAFRDPARSGAAANATSTLMAIAKKRYALTDSQVNSIFSALVANSTETRTPTLAAWNAFCKQVVREVEKTQFSRTRRTTLIGKLASALPHVPSAREAGAMRVFLQVAEAQAQALEDHLVAIARDRGVQVDAVRQEFAELMANPPEDLLSSQQERSNLSGQLPADRSTVAALRALSPSWSDPDELQWRNLNGSDAERFRVVCLGNSGVALEIMTAGISALVPVSNEEAGELATLGDGKVDNLVAKLQFSALVSGALKLRCPSCNEPVGFSHSCLGPRRGRASREAVVVSIADAEFEMTKDGSTLAIAEIHDRVQEWKAEGVSEFQVSFFTSDALGCDALGGRYFGQMTLALKGLTAEARDGFCTCPVVKCQHVEAMKVAATTFIGAQLWTK